MFRGEPLQVAVLAFGRSGKLSRIACKEGKVTREVVAVEKGHLAAEGLSQSSSHIKLTRLGIARSKKPNKSGGKK